MAVSEVKIEGMEEFSQKIKTLQDKKALLKRARASARKAMQLVQFAAKVGASRIDDPKTKESIQENIVVRYGKTRDKSSVMVRVGVLGGAKSYANTKENVRSGKAGKTYQTDGNSANPGGDTFYWRYVELGTSKVQADPFMRPALANNIQAVTDEFAKEFMKSVESAIRRGKLT
ncbi:hypothetical protein APD36_06585 [Acinetobacter pittii]|uniref:HK97-gp10 family putative phage morphogenesis protein n=1 Tax=Acinetobacter pittii TaxID=48296 RepID=UPI0007077BBF|nr:HK97-gp10 family putative phage morphogenesis protein [Acinetobacter pittii]KQE16785.1 hypothetical protein APD36_06585 [Acinetobacter pittii]